MPQPASQEEVVGYFQSLSNWGRWGADDRLGTLNLITAQKRLQAAALIRDGESVSCSRLIPRSAPNIVNMMRQSGERYALGDDMPSRQAGYRGLQQASEYIAFAFHGVLITHLDSLGHIFWNGQMYNGISSASVKAGEGSTYESVDMSGRDGIMSRGVLLDIARLKGKPWLTGDEPVYPEDLEAAERAQGVRVESGDVLLLRTGHPSRLAAGDATAGPGGDHSGFQAACLPWLHERGVAMIASDTINDCAPRDYPQTALPIHQIAIVAMGLRLVDNADFERLGEVCAAKSRWEFAFALNPLRLEAATGSPANPIATF